MPYEESQRLNLRGQVYKAYDQSGVVVNNQLDFKGNKLAVQKGIAEKYDVDIDWAPATSLRYGQEADDLLLKDEVSRKPILFTQITEYDALNRMTRLYNWHRGVGTRVAVYEPTYNERGLLLSEDLVVNAIKREETYDGGTRTHTLRQIAYDAKGQKTSVEYGTGEETGLFQCV